MHIIPVQEPITSTVLLIVSHFQKTSCYRKQTKHFSSPLSVSNHFCRPKLKAQSEKDTVQRQCSFRMCLAGGLHAGLELYFPSFNANTGHFPATIIK